MTKEESPRLFVGITLLKHGNGSTADNGISVGKSPITARGPRHDEKCKQQIKQRETNKNWTRECRHRQNLAVIDGFVCAVSTHDQSNGRAKNREAIESIIFKTILNFAITHCQSPHSEGAVNMPLRGKGGGSFGGFEQQAIIRPMRCDLSINSPGMGVMPTSICPTHAVMD